MILDKRTIRDFRDNLPRNISMILIIALSMALVVALCSSTDCITETIYREWKSCNVEDGSFETCIPLSKRNFKELSELDAEIEQMFYFDISANNVSTLRLFTVRNRIDLLYTESGNIPKSDGEIFLEKNMRSLTAYLSGIISRSAEKALMCAESAVSPITAM